MNKRLSQAGQGEGQGLHGVNVGLTSVRDQTAGDKTAGSLSLPQRPVPAYKVGTVVPALMPVIRSSHQS